VQVSLVDAPSIVYKASSNPRDDPRLSADAVIPVAIDSHSFCRQCVVRAFVIFRCWLLFRD